MTLHHLLIAGIAVTSPFYAQPESLRLESVTVTPHLQSTEMRYRREPDRSLGARVQLFIRNTGQSVIRLTPEAPIYLRGKSPADLLAADEWAWHDFPSAWTNEPLVLPPNALTVWTFNGKRAPWGVGTSAEMTIGLEKTEVQIDEPRSWLSSVTFLGEATNPYPDSLILHVANHTASPLRMQACRLWLPANNETWRVLLPQPWMTNRDAFPADRVVPAQDKGGARISTGRLPLTYAAVEVHLTDANGKTHAVWAHLRIKREVFDIGGGWLASKLGNSNTLTFEPYLKTLRRMHINAGQHDTVPGYTDNAALFAKYPLKYINRCQPVDRYDADTVLPRIHAVEFLGEPQYGGGRPVPPMEVWRAFAPYQKTRLPTSVTHSEERIWRFYAGLSDYPHYDAYRVCAPAPDSWSAYDRWNGRRIRWGAPLETIGDMTRSLRDLNRPSSTAYWSQGAHSGWDSYGGRKRTSPTADELRSQAYHALSSRITSLYWFNLSLKSLLKFPDLIDPITRVNREIRLLDGFYLEGDAYHYERLNREGKPDWDLAVIAGPQGALLFALDLAYSADGDERVFKFNPPRDATFSFRLPAYLQKPKEVFRVDADGIAAVRSKPASTSIQISDRAGCVAIYVVGARADVREVLDRRLKSLLDFENGFQFDPARNDADLATLRSALDKPATR